MSCRLDFDSGFSDIIGIKELTDLGLKTDNGGSWCRSDGPLGKYFNISRVKRKGKIDSVQLVGFKQNDFTGKIDSRIVEAYKNDKCRVLAVGGKFIEIDHKDGRKHDFKLHDNQTIEDFQPLHKTCNVAKRQHCKVCVETGVRFDATQLGFSQKQTLGTEEYHGSCIGCYWHDPELFVKTISASYVKLR